VLLTLVHHQLRARLPVRALLLARALLALPRLVALLPVLWLLALWLLLPCLPWHLTTQRLVPPVPPVQTDLLSFKNKRLRALFF